jgi:hypothetical protein
MIKAIYKNGSLDSKAIFWAAEKEGGGGETGSRF